ncbi:MAG: Eco57I restriction-modification methylase domain-containing protein [Candidatus Peribacter sp.]|nr:Eco57I restriction-modification methylase domain-containing protein [Candidatus Peribacter sp.]
MPAPQQILTLVEHFKRKREELKAVRYKEAQLRVEFLDPLLEALGWDVRNTQGHTEAFKEVIHEDAIRIGDAMKAPDYCMKIGRDRKFFVEAKKPSVDIKGEPTPALQLRRYAWSAKLPLSILTDFEEFAIYDCRIRPHKADKASTARIFFCTFEEYAKRWDEIAAIFSKDAVLSGSFDKYAGEKRRGTQEVDDEFLKEIEHWRELLAKNIATRNTSLGQQEMNYAVQQTIDRIIFLRICEDRGLETYGRLQAELNGSGIYGRLIELFREADARYNSGLFHFKEEKSQGEPPDTVTPHLTIDDAELKEIITCLYPPESPYAFSVFSSEILGQVYEQFLGKVIRLTEGHHAKVEEKPEVRKAGGVYYTPKYIVDYIVEHTVGKLLEGKTPKQVAELKIVDPACGSGSFLIGAYQLLLDWHIQYYTEHEPKKWKKELYSLALPSSEGGPQWRLTTAERKRILLNNIFGVDIDPQAVEVTKLSLLLKVLEGETAQSMQTQMFRERVLPDLGKNIQCGNSLIGPDFYDGEQQTLLDTEDADRQRINVFDWESAFPDVFKRKNPGFDAVIGNPPYLNIDDVWGRGDVRLQAIKRMYPAIYNDKTDLLFYFVAKAAQISRKYVSFIVSRAFLEAYKADKLRGWLLHHTTLKEIIDFQNFYVFSGIGITTSIVTLDLDAKAGKIAVYKLRNGKEPRWDLAVGISDRSMFERHDISQPTLSAAPWNFVDSATGNLNAKIDAVGVPVGDILVIGQGMQTGLNEVFGNRTIEEIKKWKVPEGMKFRRASNTDIQRYSIRDRGEYLLYLENAADFSKLPPSVRAHLSSHEAELKERAAYKRGDCLWWKYTWPLHAELYDRPRILCPYLATRNRFALDLDHAFIGLTDTTVLFDNQQPEDLHYLMGLLNSRLLTFRYKSIGKLKSGGILEYFWNGVSKLSIRRIDFSKSEQKVKHDHIVSHVKQVLMLQRETASAKTPHEQESLKRQIGAIDRKIDELVYELYGLTEKEISIIERDI